MSDMRAAFLHGPGDLRLGRLPRPRPGPGEVLLKVSAVGICGSDLHYYLEGGIGSARISAPLVLGHEIAARVVDERAASLGLAPGALVAVDPSRPCQCCEWCREGHPNLCPEQVFAGSPPGNHGALAEYFAAPVEALFPVPPGWAPAAAALLETLGVAVHALDLARVRLGDSVAVLGTGPLGLLLVQAARAAGAGRVYAIDPLEYRARQARSLGADEAAVSHEAVRDWTRSRGVDVALEASNSPLGPRQAAEVVRIGGRLVLAGIPAGDGFNLSASVLQRKGLTIKMVRRMGRVYPRAIELVESGQVQLAPLVTHTFPLEQTAAAFALQAPCREGVLKAVIEPGMGG